MGVGKARCSLVMDSALSGPTDWRRGWWRSLHRTESGTQEWGPGVQVGHVFLGYPARGIDSRITGQSSTACFGSSTVVRTERWKVMK